MSTRVARMLPLYEAKMMHQFEHRWASYQAGGKAELVSSAQRRDRNFRALPRYWVREEVAEQRLPAGWDRDWLLGWRDICRSTDERTLIATILGEGARPEGGFLILAPEVAQRATLLVAILNSFVVDYVARQMVGGTHLKYFVMRQLPVLGPQGLEGKVPWSPGEDCRSWFDRRTVALLDTADDMKSFVGSFPGIGKSGSNLPGREVIRAELDAACFHLYGIERDDVDYIMETFPIVKRKDEAAYGEYRTKRLILEFYDAMAEAKQSGARYRSSFDGQGD